MVARLDAMVARLTEALAERDDRIAARDARIGELERLLEESRRRMLEHDRDAVQFQTDLPVLGSLDVGPRQRAPIAIGVHAVATAVSSVSAVAAFIVHGAVGFAFNRLR